MIVKKILILLTLLFSTQMGAEAQEVRDFTFSHLGTVDGLRSQRIYSIVQTGDGALWWSNKEGVERYNGLQVKFYQTGNFGVVSSYAGRVNKLTLGCDSVLTVFDNKGCIFVYDEEQDTFRLFADVSEMIEGDVLLNDVVLTKKGIWLAMREGVYFLKDSELIPVVKNVYTNAFVATRYGLMICTRNGVLGFSAKMGDVPKENMTLPKLLDYNVESGYYDVQYNKVWLGGFLNGLRILTPDEDGLSPHYELIGDAICNPVRSICPYDEFTMLVGIDGLGVFKVTRQPSANGKYKGVLLFDANEGAHGVLHGNGIYSVVRDCWDNIVIGSYSGGIDIARPVGSTPAVFQHVRENQQSLLNDHVNCVSQWPGGMMIMGTDNGVSMHDPNTQQWKHTCYGAVALSLCRTPQGTMLASTYGKGVYEITENGQAVQLYTKNNGVLKDDHVYKLLYDRQGDLWMGCLDGDLVQMSAKGCHYYPINNVQDIVQLPDGRVAVGTANGIWIVDGRTSGFKELDYSSINPGDVNRYVLTMFVNNSQELWIGTDGGGVYVYDLVTKSGRQLTKANGLPSNTVCSICKDGKGRILIATEKGLSFVGSDHPNAVVDVNYCYGLSREYSARAVINLVNGHVLYGTSSGALIINPDNIQEINYSARLKITGVRCSADDSEQFNKRVHGMLKDGKLRLHYNERTFDLYFECVNLRNQFDIACQYRVGSGEWSQPFDRQYIRFTNLEPGTHQLMLRSVSRTCGKVLDEKSLTIIIAQPWWSSWWMWVIYVSLILLAFYGAWRVYQLHTKYMRLVLSSASMSPELSVASECKESHDIPEEEREETIQEAAERKKKELPKENAEENGGKEFVDKVTKIVVENIKDTDFNIDSLCREMAMSRTLFYIKLKTYTGNSPQDFIRVIRLERAATLLRSGRSVAETAMLTGFDNTKYFSTVFKKYFDISPSKYC